MSRRAEAGLTLVELLVAMVITLILMLGVYGVMVWMKGDYVIVSDRTTAESTGRAALEIFGADDDSGGDGNPLIQGARLPRTQLYGVAVFSLIATYAASEPSWARSSVLMSSTARGGRSSSPRTVPAMSGTSMGSPLI